MVTLMDADRWRSASHRNSFTHLTGPLQTGAVEVSVPIVVDGGLARVTIEVPSVTTLIVVTLRQSLGLRSLRLVATVTPDGQPPVPVQVMFASWTESGMTLPIGRATPGLVSSIELHLFSTADGIETEVQAGEIAGLTGIRLIEGTIGSVLYLLGVENGRIRREGRELMASRSLATARDNALDRIGAELGVPRFTDDLRVVDGEITSVIEGEPDAAYRNRLQIYRPFLQPTRPRLLERLNGPDGAVNTGLLAKLGVQGRVAIADEDNPFAVAIHLVDSAGGVRRTNFLEHIRQSRLVWPTADGDASHLARKSPPETRQRVQAIREDLAARCTWPVNAAIAPMLADVLRRYTACRMALGLADPVTVVRAQDAGAGSRFELGLGIEIVPPSNAQLDTLFAAMTDPNRPPAADPETEALLSLPSPVPEDAANDPEGAWLFHRCGLRTVHQTDAGNLYLSHLPTFGLRISGPAGVPEGQADVFDASYSAPGDTGVNVVLSAAIDAALANMEEEGIEPPVRLTTDEAHDVWDSINIGAPSADALKVIGIADLPSIDAPDLPRVITQLQALPGEMLVTFQLPGALSDRILAGEEDAAADLRAYGAQFRAQGLASMLPLVKGDEDVVLVVSTIGLPRAGVNLADRRTTGFRWYAIPISGEGGAVSATGTRATYDHASGLTALVVLGYARRGGTDPYEYRVELGRNELLTIKQYEFLMNLLAHDSPIGVEINTFSLRQEHVDLDGDAVANPLPPSVARTFRAFQRIRHRGATAVDVSVDPIDRW